MSLLGFPLVPIGKDLPVGIACKQGDKFTINAAGSAALTTAPKVRVTLNFVGINGDVGSQQVDVVSNTDRSFASNVSTDLPDGVITSANVTLLTGTNPGFPGILYVTSSLLRAGSGIAQILGGYVYVGGPNLAYPPGPIWGPMEGRGRIYNVLPTAPAVASEVIITVPARALWRIMSLNIKIVRDANAANVTHHLVIDDGTSTGIFDQGNGETPAAVATNTRNYIYQPGRGVALETSFDANNFIRLPILNPPGGLFLENGARIRTVTTSIQAGDQYTIPALWVEEWLAGA